MDHRQFLASLTPEQTARLYSKSDARGIAHLASHGGAVVVLGGLIAAKIPFWPVLLLPQGILLVFLFTLLHETVHRTPFNSEWINVAAGRVCGFILLIEPEWFRFFHLAHHRHTQDPDNDPELATAKPETMGHYIRYVSGLPIWWGAIRTLDRNALGRCDDAYVPMKARGRVAREARIMLAGYGASLVISLWYGTAVLFWVWVLPAVIGQPFLRLYLLAEHGRCPLVANMLENSRTTFTTGFVRWLAWNMPYHAEHHSLPNVPFHRLPELHDLVASHLRQTENGYARFHRHYVAGLQRPEPTPR